MINPPSFPIFFGHDRVGEIVEVDERTTWDGFSMLSIARQIASSRNFVPAIYSALMDIAAESGHAGCAC
jgi:hypothetical protein